MIFGLVNLAAILVAAIVDMVIGFVWYSPFLFGPMWMRLRGKEPARREDMQFPASKMILEFVCALVTAFVLALYLPIFAAVSVTAAIIFTLTIWVGFYVTTLLGEVVWEDKSFGLFLINGGLRLVTLIAMTLVLTWWQ